MKKKTLQRILVLVFGLAFLSSTVFLLLGSLVSGDWRSQSAVRDRSSSSSTTTQNSSSAEEQLRLQARGYQKVLEREPDNITALSGLVQTRLQMGDLEGAVTPLEKLVELNPQEENFQILLEAIKEELAQKQQPNQTIEENK